MTPQIAWPFRLLSPGGARAKLSIFIFHRVLVAPDPLLRDDPDAERFERIVEFIARHFRVLQLTDAATRLRAGTLPAASACITFDDGYADNFAVAAPILQRYGAVATFFISTGFINGGRMWNDTVIEAIRGASAGVLDWTDLGFDAFALTHEPASRVAAYKSVLKDLKYRDPAQRGEVVDEIARRSGLPRHANLMMTVQQLRDLRGMGMELGGHTVSHPILKLMSDAGAEREIAGCREQLASWIGEEPAAFAYPDGRPGRAYGERDVAIVRRAGYAVAVTTGAGVARAGTDILQLPRFTPWDGPMWKFGVRSAMNISGMIA